MPPKGWALASSDVPSVEGGKKDLLALGQSARRRDGSDHYARLPHTSPVYVWWPPCIRPSTFDAFRSRTLDTHQAPRDAFCSACELLSCHMRT